jgi:hypothetical protein
MNQSKYIVNLCMVYLTVLPAVHTMYEGTSISKGKFTGYLMRLDAALLLQRVETSIGQVLTMCNRWQDKRNLNGSVRIVAALLENCIREEQHSVIRFLWSEGVKPKEIDSAVWWKLYE